MDKLSVGLSYYQRIGFSNIMHEELNVEFTVKSLKLPDVFSACADIIEISGILCSVINNKLRELMLGIWLIDTVYIFNAALLKKHRLLISRLSNVICIFSDI